MKEPPADILRRLRPIPTDRPRAAARDLEGVDPSGAPLSIEIVGAAAPVLLLFLSAACVGCRDLWEGLTEFQAGLADACRLAVVTRSPGDEDSSAVATLGTLGRTRHRGIRFGRHRSGARRHRSGARRHRSGARRHRSGARRQGPVPDATGPVPVVMSTAAYGDYRVDGPPFYAVVGSAVVLGEGVAWGVEATLQAVRATLVASG